ncbi:MAG: Fic family protein [Limnohabitans sp.]|jgi:Fic family protein
MLTNSYSIPAMPPQGVNLDAPDLLKTLAVAHRHLAELKGCAKSIPNQGILINTLTLQEAKASSEIESFVTTQDELFQADLQWAEWTSPAAKEVSRYREALRHGFEQMQAQQGLLTNGGLIALFQTLKNSSEGFRKIPGTVLKNDRSGETVYVPPQSAIEVQQHMNDLERFINDADAVLDPLVKMALIHHQFESIHPFSDGNGRIGRIVCVLYLTKAGLLNAPILYLSRYINQHKTDYYRLLQAVREQGVWHDWLMFMLRGVAETAQSTVVLVEGVRDLMAHTKLRLRTELPKLYSQDLLNNLFHHPYTRIDFVQQDLGVTRQTAAKYLKQLAQTGIVQEVAKGKHLYFINTPLVELLVKGDRS